MNTVWFRFLAAGVGGAVVLGVAAPAFADDWPPESAIPPEKGMVMVTVRGGCFTMGDFVGEG